MAKLIEDQIKETAETYSRRVTAQIERESGGLTAEQRHALLINLKAAVLSGITLAADFIAANDGHDVATPSNLVAACLRIGTEWGFRPERGVKS
jgi:hypothetical protein